MKRVIAIVLVLLLIVGIMPTVSVYADSYVWPVVDPYVTQDFGSLYDTLGKHLGLDLKSSTNNLSIRATTSSTVFYASVPGTVAGEKDRASANGYRVILKHNDGLFSSYSHLDSVLVKTGDTVYAGKQIGIMGKTGRGTGVHLHFMIFSKSTTDPSGYAPSNTPLNADGSITYGSGIYNNPAKVFNLTTIVSGYWNSNNNPVNNEFIAISNGLTTFSSNSSQDPVGRLYDGNGSLLAYNDDAFGTKNFFLRVNLIAGQRYRLQVSEYSGRVGSFTVLISPNVQLLSEITNPSVANVPSDACILYEHIDYQGRSWIYRPGSYMSPYAGFPNDLISSIRVGSQVQIQCGEHDQLGGRTEIYKRDVSNLCNTYLGNDVLSSFVINYRTSSTVPTLSLPLDIRRALYGTNEENFLDITSSIRANVNNNSLSLTVSNSLAPYDPAYGIRKFLRIIYRNYLGQEYQADFWEGTGFTINNTSREGILLVG